MKNLFVFAQITIVFLIAKQLKAHDFTTDQKWLNLYRYQINFGKHESLVINQDWFFSENGRSHPQQEGIAAIKKFTENKNYYCLYPARASHLISLALISPVRPRCPKLSALKNKLALQKVSLVFASSYINNPSSAFGHTLFKLIGKNEDNPYLNWGLNFAAIQTTNNPLAYAFKGLTGQFVGTFSLLPYFVKLKEYQDSENRDLWEYQLNLSQKELDEFVEHLWEMKGAKFSYYYLSENCSFHLLSFLDALNPNFHFQKELNHFVMPSETLKVIASQKEFISQVNYHPSPFKKLANSLKELPNKNKDEISSSLSGAFSTSGISTESIDWLIDYSDFQQSMDREEQHKGYKEKLLLTRSKRTEEPKKSIIKAPLPPHLEAPPALILLGHRRDLFSRSLYQIRVRASYREYLDPQINSLTNSQLIFGEIGVSYQQEEKKVRLDQFTLVKVESNKQDLFNFISPSWGVNLQLKDRALTRDYDLAPTAEVHYGINFKSRDFLLRLFAPLSLQYGKKPRRVLNPENFSLMVSPQFEAIARLGTYLNLRVGVGYFYNTLLEKDLKTFSKYEMRLHLPAGFSLDTSAIRRLKEWDYSLNLIKYF